MASNTKPVGTHAGRSYLARRRRDRRASVATIHTAWCACPSCAAEQLLPSPTDRAVMALQATGFAALLIGFYAFAAANAPAIATALTSGAH
ncbi:hypothetical protein [Roseisolibacter sp. H3M3-2]|uniref:hypothetical protein n=1 Tax=Roseisolibacter sp. H3M3-2 TaxID=3031323 RepID=UPI0023DC2C16|nr:hypothetical protein [Roseisolibacter sp. H3M3-2]MDF1506311.1 hypothetical protein [Roseisolibacter sp. H3M3-2]